MGHHSIEYQHVYLVPVGEQVSRSRFDAPVARLVGSRV